MSQHIVTKKHRKFAMDDNNFRHLDKCLARVRRRTVEEAAETEARFLDDAIAQTDPAPPTTADF